MKENGGKRVVMIKKKGAQSVILNIDFSYYGRLLHLITGNPEDSKYLEELERQFPNDYEKRINLFLDHKYKRHEARK